MPTEEWQTYCPHCERIVLGRRETPNHLIHFLIFFFSCGLWAIPWALFTWGSKNKPFLCTICGTSGVNR